VQQLPLVLRVAPEFDLDAFCFADGRDQRLLLEVLAASRHQALLLVGASGAGKSYLLKALMAHGGHYLSASQMTSNIASTEARKPDAKLYLVDDLDLALKDVRAEEWLFHDFNRAVDLNIPWIAAAQLTPANLDFVLPDLRSRLSQALIVRLPVLRDAESRMDVLKKLAASFGAELDDGVITYLETHVTRDLAQLAQWIQRLNAHALAEKKRLTIPGIRALLKQGNVAS
jgi:DnaA-homolog protein